MTQPLGVILAGGRGTRMGHTDKATLILGGQTLLQRAIDRLEPQVAALAVNTNTDLPTEFTRLPDSITGHPGPLAGILAALDWAAAMGARHVVTVPVDVPFFPCDLVPRLLLAAEAHPVGLAIAADESGLHPTFGLWPVDLRPDLSAALDSGVRKVTDWTDQFGAAQAHFPTTEPSAFLNVNRPEDLARAEAALANAT
ncbi:molybdenum cofactor guanylyltransferase MobA [Salibaculum griseiflavum]|uniref:Molybdenum cofactor guanylyltransferase n=1 Tax=Salibaculum griseiflavum TaxID=1914409 RepID=A0A2V1P5N5_9RHOB|nr:molybdenum cofactor guanylyltransferase MobA [Salibaculum griseiflavum]PWG16532.1 molybdenum cofactor guanylyltransferase [Salibaculum griseiflavum]